MTPTMLTTPLGIYKAVTAVFSVPPAEVNVVKEPQLQVTVTISPRIPPMSFYFAIDAQKFRALLNQMKTYLDMARLNPNMHSWTPVNPDSLSLPSLHLTNWQQWERTLWEEKGGNTIHCLLTYLGSKTNLSEVSALGLAPSQIEKKPTEEDLAYFRDVYNGIENVDSYIAALYRDNMKVLYPNIYQQIIDELKTNKSG